MNKSYAFDESIKRVVFDKIMLNLTQVHHIPKEQLEGWNLDIVLKKIENSDYNELVYHLKNFIVHGKREVKHYHLVPINWWESFKEEVIYSDKRWWYYRKHPKIGYYIARIFGSVKHRQIETSVVYMRYCPHVKTPDTSCHIEFLQFENTYNFWDGKCNEAIK